MTPLDLGDWFRDTALDGSLVLAIPVALVAGLVSFFSPCVVPLLPGYLSYATGLSGADLAEAKRGRMLTGSLLFVLGFSFVFVSFGALIGGVGEFFFEYERQITIVLGSLTIVLGLVFLGVVPWMQRDWRVHQVPAVGLAAAPLLGVLFGLGWAPCIGPTLSAVLFLSANEASAGRGALLTFVYCLGLGPAVHRGGAGLPPHARHGRVGTPPPAVGHRHRRGDADRRRAAAGHRLVGRAGRLDPRVVLPRLRDGRLMSREKTEPRPTPTAMGPLELARWAWRQLTSMRTALILLFLLALASIPGSVVPQEAVDSLRASQWRDQHPKLTPIYEQLGLFSVYNSAWFSAIYILLVISLVGCFLPRMRVYWRGVRARPPGAPRHLSRMPQHRTFETDEAPEVTLERAQAWLRRKHFRVAGTEEGSASPERPASARSAATCGRPATCCSTSRC